MSSSLIRPKPPVPTPIDPIPLKIYSDGYKGVTVDSSVTPLANIIQFVEGHIWEVEYYSQVLGRDNEPQPNQQERSAVYEQFTRIKGLEIRVSSPLVPEHDAESGSMTLTGSAFLPADIVPSKGDTFLADIGQGREAQFTVTSVSRKTHYAQSVYQIEYDAVGYSDHNVSAIRHDLGRKTIKEFHFVKDYRYLGVYPLVLDKTLTDRIEMDKLYKELIAAYTADFYSYEYRTFLVPDQEVTTYDPFITSELLKWVDVNDARVLLDVHRPRVTTGYGRIPDTVWTAMSKANHAVLMHGMHKAGLVGRDYFRAMPDLGGFFYTGIERCVYPMDGSTEVDAGYESICPPGNEAMLNRTRGRFYDLKRIGDLTALDGLWYKPDENKPLSLPHIAPVNLAGYYVFSEAFYTGEGALASNLERLIHQQLKHDTIDSTLLIDVAKTAMRWENLERFYYIPALIALLKTATRIN